MVPSSRKTRVNLLCRDPLLNVNLLCFRLHRVQAMLVLHGFTKRSFSNICLSLLTMSECMLRYLCPLTHIRNTHLQSSRSGISFSYAARVSRTPLPGYDGGNGESPLPLQCSEKGGGGPLGSPFSDGFGFVHLWIFFSDGVHSMKKKKNLCATCFAGIQGTTLSSSIRSGVPSTTRCRMGNNAQERSVDSRVAQVRERE
jgi:hypothetical protein